MADNLIFPIGFDLDSAVKKGASDWDGKYADQLEKAIQKHSIKVKLQFDTRYLNNLDAVKQRLAQLKIEPITPETKTAIKELAAELRTLAKALEQVQKYSSGRGAASPDAVRAARINAINQQIADKAAIAYENQRAAAARAAAAEERLAIARVKSAQAAANATKGVNNLTNAYNSQLGVLERLAKKMVAVWSINQVRTFITSIREVTAQFELQRVSLGAILQDQTKANQLFSEIKSFAIKSPISIIDLTKYTKQVAAYKIETDKLFDTTKRLADVSVGLGVDMGRLVLAYGQVKAASYLRAAEIRQFTEAGIPLLELLAEKFTDLQGSAVSTEEVMDKVSKRMVSFSMVEEIFKDMTSAGGMFYEMQEKQGNTLFGLWAKLGDAASLMYDEIGNTDVINSGMKAAIQVLTDMMKNWRLVGMAIAGVSIIYLKHKIAVANAVIAENLLKEATMQKALALSFEKNALMQKMAAQTKATLLTRIDNQMTLASINAKIAAATATNVFSKALHGMKAALLSNPIGLAVTALITLGTVLYDAYRKSQRLNDELSKIGAEQATATDQSVRNFEHLANAAVNAADGSKAQREALEELKRTYRDILPVEDLKIEKLRAMKGDYSELTMAIEEYIAAQQKQKSLDIVNEIYGGEIHEMGKKVMENLKGMGFSAGEASRFLSEFLKQADVAGKTFQEKIEDAIKNADLKLSDKQIEQLLGDKSGWRWWLDEFFDVTTTISLGASQLWKRSLDTSTDVERLAEAQMGLSESTKEVTNQFALQTNTLGKYAIVMGDIQKEMSEFTPMKDGKPLDNSTYEFQVQTNSEQVNKWGIAIKQELAKAGVQIKDEWIKINEDLSETDPAKWAALNMQEIIKAVDGAKFPQMKKWLQSLQKDYENIRPSDGLVNTVNSKFKQIADSVGVNMDLVHNYMMKTGQSLKDFRKSLEDESKALAESIKSLSLVSIISLDYAQKQQEKADAEQRKKVIDSLLAALPDFSKGNGSKSKPQETRLQNLQEIESTLTSINKKYEELKKKEGETAALNYVKKNYASTLKYVNEIAKKFKLNFAMPTDFKDLQAYRESILDLIKKLKMKGYERAAIELELKIADGEQERLEKDIEKRLKDLADKISRTKTAREFYEKILSQTGDVELAASISLQLYGSDGRELDAMVKEQFQKAFESIGNDHPELVAEISSIIDRGAYEELRDYISQLPADAQKAADDLVKAQQQMSAKQYEQWLKDLEKAKDFADKRIELSRTTANQITAIEGRISRLNPQSADYASQKAMLEKMIADYGAREDKEAAKIEYDMFKDMPLYVQMFDNLDNASTTMLTNMKNLLEKNKAKWGEFLDPTQLKEMQSRMNEIDKQLAARNPFKTLSKSLKEWWALRKSGRNRRGISFQEHEKSRIAQNHFVRGA